MPTIALDAERTLTTAQAEVRAAILRSLATLGYAVASAGVTSVDATRGSALGESVRGHDQMPMAVSARFNPGPAGTGVAIRVCDAYPNAPVLLSPDAAAQCITHCHTLLRFVDAQLAQLDPRSVVSWPEPTLTAPSMMLTDAVSTAVGGGAAIPDMARRPRGARVPPGWRDLDRVMFSVPASMLMMSPAELQAHLATALLVTSVPGSLPPKLTTDLISFGTRVEDEVARRTGPVIRIDLSPTERKVVDFLLQQWLIREALPLRMLNTCHTCRLERVTNPDYQRLVKRNMRVRTILGSLGGSISSHGVSLFVLVGTLVKIAPLDPDFVCQRCQGTSADQRVITFCPSCGEMRREAVLRACAKCSFDLRSIVPRRDRWISTASEEMMTVALPAILAPPAPPPPLPPAAVPSPLGMASDPTGPVPWEVVPASRLPQSAVLPDPGSPPAPGEGADSPPGLLSPALATSVTADIPSPPRPSTGVPVAGPTRIPGVASFPSLGAPPAPSPAAAARPAADGGPRLHAGGPLLGPEGGKVCDICGGEFPTIWRVVVEGSSGAETVFVCGITARCSPVSTAAPVPA